jgi:predicted acylesterase/phospholipase RssA
MSPAKRTTSSQGSISDNSGVPAASELFEAIQEWAARDPNAARETIELIRARAKGAPEPPKGPPLKKRAICLGGGGPAAGLHIGVLKGLRDKGITFDTKDDVWALSCIGAWVGIVYNQAPQGRGIEETTKFFWDVFRNDPSFKSYPTNTVFTPDWAGNAEAMWEFLLEPSNYRNAFLPREIMKSFVHTLSAIRRGSAMRRRTSRYRGEEFEDFEFEGFSEGDFNRWTLNHVLAVNPAVRFLTALLYKSKVDGLSRLYYPDSRFLKQINFDEVRKEGKPFISYNAWNLSQQELVLYANRPKPAKPIKSRHKVVGYRSIDAASLCACSALPFVLQTITIDGDIYCEGALIDTVNFEHLLEDHADLDEIWISRIVDPGQVLPPRNLHDSLANLCELFCATVGEDDVELFKCHITRNPEAAERWQRLTVVEIPVDCTINFDWSHSNLHHGIAAGEHAAHQAFDRYEKEKGNAHPNGPLFIPAPDEEDKEQKKQQREQRLKKARERLKQAGRSDC